MRIDRSQLVHALRGLAQAGHCLVVGEPGVGKTYLLTDLYATLRRAGARPRYLPVDKLLATSRTELTTELRIRGDVLDELARDLPEPCEPPRLLMIDGLDSARSDRGRALYLTLAQDAKQQLAGSWHVVVGVRTYDAARSRQLLDMFPLTPGVQSLQQYTEPSIGCRHFRVPRLTVEETEAVVRQDPVMLAAYDVASAELRELLRIPFNLWLLEKLVSSAVPDLSLVSSEVELLELYWKYRVEEGQRANDRRIILKKVTKAMVGDKSLSVRKDPLYEYGWSTDWDELLSSEVLASDERGLRVSYKHAILFDFAVARLLIEDDPTLLEQFVLADPARPLFLRPSLVYHLTRLWYEVNPGFWSTFWHLLQSQDARLRLFARLLPTSVVLNETRTPEDVKPLLDKLEAGEVLALDGFFRLVQAYNALQPGRDETWVRVLERVASLKGVLDRKSVWGVAVVAEDILKRAETSGDAELRTVCGAIGRNLLTWALDGRATEPDTVDSFAPRLVLPIVLKTFDANVDGSRELVNRTLAMLNEERFPIQYFWVLAEHVDLIWPSDPELAADIYVRIFTRSEQSDEKTPFGGSLIVPMSSTRRQDYDMVEYVLAEKFGKFLEAKPLVAAQTVIDCLNKAILVEHIVPHLVAGAKVSDMKPEEFQFLGGKAGFLPDASYIWDESYHTSKLEDMADSLFNTLGHVPGNPPPTEHLDDMLLLFRDRAVWAYFWRKLLDAGAQHANVYKERLYELCVAEPILRSLETLEPLGDFLQAAAGLWSASQVENVEQAILRLPEGKTESKSMAHWEHRRNRLLARIPQDRLQTVEGRKLRAEMESTGTVPDNEPLFRVTTYSGGEVTDEDWVKRQGSEPEKPENRRLLDLGKPLDHWARERHNKKPDKLERAQIAKAVKDAYEALLSTEEADVPVQDTVWTHLASACEAMARSDDLTDDEFGFCREVLLKAAALPAAAKSADDDAQYNWPGWGGTAQSEAAIGLTLLASRKPDDEVLAAIRVLALERYTGIRSPTVRYLGSLYNKSSQFFWGLVKEVTAGEQNAVILAALPSVMWSAAGREPDKVVEVLEMLEPKIASEGTKMDPGDRFVPLVIGLAIAMEHEGARAMATRWLENPLANAGMLNRATLSTMDFVTPKQVSDAKRRPEVNRAVTWLHDAVKAAAAGLAGLRGQVSGQMNEAQQQLYREVYGVFDHVVGRVFHESGVFEHRSKDQEPVTPEELARFHDAVKPLLVSILTLTAADRVGILLAPVAHQFMEYLNGVLKYDAADVLHMATLVVTNSVPSGYNLDSMAVKEVVRLVEAILADHREIAQGGQGLDDILVLLDAFANAGWPGANRLVWRLDDIFR